VVLELGQQQGKSHCQVRREVVQDLGLLPRLFGHVSLEPKQNAAEKIMLTPTIPLLFRRRTSASRQGSASVFQITLHKNLNAFNRVEGALAHTSLDRLRSGDLDGLKSVE
jgi:hypothetical protein